VTGDTAAPASLLPVPGDWITQGGAVGMLGLVVLLILMGQLVPRRTVRSIEAERDLWRDVALRAMGHTDALLPGAQIAAQVTQALSEATGPQRVVTSPDRGDVT
jgi:hypothetical protein